MSATKEQIDAAIKYAREVFDAATDDDLDRDFAFRVALNEIPDDVFAALFAERARFGPDEPPAEAGEYLITGGHYDGDIGWAEGWYDGGHWPYPDSHWLPMPPAPCAET